MPHPIVTPETPVPAPAIARGPTHTLSILVNNQPGVLMRICQVFSRRGFNIDSLVVSEGRNANFSRMTIGVSGDPEGLSQIIMQVGKLIDVIHCFEHTSDNSVTKEMILIKIQCSPVERSMALQIAEHRERIVIGGLGLNDMAAATERLVASAHATEMFDDAAEAMKGLRKLLPF